MCNKAVQKKLNVNVYLSLVNKPKTVPVKCKAYWKNQVCNTGREFIQTIITTQCGIELYIKIMFGSFKEIYIEGPIK